MRIGVAREVKPEEGRVSLTPEGARELQRDGHRVLVEKGAGAGSGFADGDYVQSGAQIAGRKEVWGESELLCKVKEPVEEEYGLLRPELALFTFLHLAANPGLTRTLTHSGALALAYETVEDERGGLPLLAPMSEIAGRLATQAAAYFLQGPQGGSGVLIGGAPGVAPARVLVLGGGSAGTEAARVAVGMGGDVTVLELSLPRIRELEAMFEGRAHVLMSDTATIERLVPAADVVIGAVLNPGARSPLLITREHVSSMRPGSVIVDVAIDQGGCAETSRPTTHQRPSYELAGVIHYCVSNMPGAVPTTSTRALTNATLPYLRKLAAVGISPALSADPGLARAVNVRSGEIVCRAVAEAFAQCNRPAEGRDAAAVAV